MNYVGKECDVTAYRDDYEAITGVRVANIATAWQSPQSGQLYIFLFNKVLWMGDSIDHSLINPNQLRHFGVMMQDDPASSCPLSIISEDIKFALELDRQGTILY